MSKTKLKTQKLVESAIMIAFATVLSVIKIAELPYGGSITAASMLPIIILAYRCGIAWGLTSGLVYAVIQQLLGVNHLGYFGQDVKSIVAVIALDYILAFTVVGLGGVFRIKGKISQSKALALGVLLAAILRYTLHTIAGATVWAGLSIPTEAALVYSLGYNATYMIPEAIINLVAAVYLSGLLDFTKPIPKRVVTAGAEAGTVGKRNLYLIATAILSLGIIYDCVAIFTKLQDPKSGSPTLAYLSEVNWISVIIVSAVALLAAAGIFIYLCVKKEMKNQKETDN